MRFLSRFNKRHVSRDVSAPLETGFHGDHYLLDLVATLMPACLAMIETGSNVGTTARYTAQTYPHIMVYSCEPDPTACKAAQKTVQPYSNAHVFKQLSPDFLYWVHKKFPQLDHSLNFYFLDAHDYGYVWPLKEEIRFITGQVEHAIILIDDAQVPNQPQFKYSAYDGQVCDIEYILDALTPGKRYTITYPIYQERTSPHHPLTGYIFVAFGTPLAEQLLTDPYFTGRVVEL
jgi:predicted O-methyltransferase YrrM